jgi:RHS repeat-associated protein
LQYDLSGNITKLTRPDGSFLQYTWNAARRMTLVTNNTGETITYGYDADGHVTSSTIKSSAAVITKQMTMAYDELGRLLRSIGAATQTTTYSYDRTDLTTQVKDPRNNLYGMAYDSLQRLVATTDQETKTTTLTRNGQDDVTAYQDPRAITTSYVRNGFGEVIQETSPDAGTTVYNARDARGLVTQMTDGRGVVTNRTYDNAGRLLSETYPAAVAENVTYTYDSILSGNKGIGRLTKITDQSGSTEFTYNALGQVITDKRTIATKVYTTSYLYNASGNITQVTYPSGRIVIYARNSLGQVVSVTTKQNATAAVANVATSITYAPMSNLITALNHGNGLATTAAYDQDYRLTSLTLKNGAANVSSLSYAYSDTINLTGITDGVTPANSNVLSYTATNRLATATGNFGSSTFAYDGVGNRVSDVNTLSAVTKTRAFTTATTSNRLSTITENAAAFRSYTYDGAGNILTDVRPGESFAFTYNKRNRPASVTRNSVAYATYGYNALEQLTTRTTSAVGGPTGQVAYIYDREGHLIAEATASTGATTRDYIWMASNDNAPVDLPLAVAEAATLYQVHTDHLGRPIRMTDSTKASVWQATYKPFGEVQTTSGTKANNLRFPGQYFQIETAYAYNWHRHYDPISGRYTQPDPLRFVDGPSVYAYAGNSPFMVTDRDGQCPMCIAMLIGAGIGVGLEYLLNGDCATWEDYALAAGLGALGAEGGLLATGGRAIGKEFSHLIPARAFKGASPTLKWLLGKGAGLNGNNVSPWFHSLTDPFRYLKGQTKADSLTKAFSNLPVIPQLLRIPAWIAGAVGGGYAGTEITDKRQ